MVEHVNGIYDVLIPQAYSHVPKFNDPTLCGWAYEHPLHSTYMWKDYLAGKRVQWFPAAHLRNSWLHHMGDSIDRWMFKFTMRYVLDEELGEKGQVLLVRYLDPSLQSLLKRVHYEVTVYSWPLANVTISFAPFSRLVRIDGLSAFTDSDTRTGRRYPDRVGGVYEQVVGIRIV
ncbi:hypothetical protein SARC_12065 [Sphaeroforma arctica JP610]|uniref:Uncharacterized protein n=1 Tax=Sphaeroforma arctica JP610 TaxID=667725 RepID=A0A0L0FF49_9EUKA|nr:hypothetical protein SARC_12065 [Sphaeroforma arctica JP610]KNC75407.1 hypothetical protein SARC_12065 [Sphaeroforma arctica JP610]|eukprot:XP_014149309.1 hypothetical protein SARC_12065 [Sphaeroforma arctica JP610]